MAQLAPIFRAPGEQALLPSASDVTALGHLQKLTGAAAYRPLQEEAIDAVLLGATLQSQACANLSPRPAMRLPTARAASSRFYMS